MKICKICGFETEKQEGFYCEDCGASEELFEEKLIKKLKCKKCGFEFSEGGEDKYGLVKIFEKLGEEDWFCPVCHPELLEE